MEFIFGINIHGYPLLGIFWNIFLAIAPCLVVYHLAKSVGQRKWKDLKSHTIAFVLIFLFWFFMFPNTAYLFMIPRHLVDYCDNYDKYRVCLDGGSWIVMIFAVYTLIGLPTFYYSLKKMGDIFKTLFNKTVSTVFPIIMIPLTSIAILLGLYSRFNSWDALFHPGRLLMTTGSYFTDTRMIVDFLVFTACLYLVYYITRYLLKDE
jgi:uncharacterized membrane protein